MINALYDVAGCRAADLAPDSLAEAMRKAVARLGCTVMGELPVQFQPHGVTMVLVLAESHLTVSTYPEHGQAYVDLFTCRADTDPDQAIEPIIAALGGLVVQGRRIDRTATRAAPTI